GEVTPGVVAVAAPILLGDNNPQGALCLTSNEADVTPETLDRIQEEVLAVSHRINAQLGDHEKSNGAVA
ncbi:MAG: IclR family transcriptional regulator, partial [Rhodobacteraceae bacterium]|nr:IclR family transcriptional regulator [Paracoccaceae bacterium]NNK66486.1 IclR family transcriptional regulator [Paracoccaceae bacterium]